MRPVDRGLAPAAYARFEYAKPDLVKAIGGYCCYCERKIETLLAVEHVLPKSLPAYQHLELEWGNFLLACVNRNSAKGDQDSARNNHLWPDEHNTYRAFYSDGHITKVRPGLAAGLTTRAQATLEMCAVNRGAPSTWSTGEEKKGAVDRWQQRKAATRKADEALREYEEAVADVIANPSPAMDRMLARLANAFAMTSESAGFFSIWMDTFHAYPEVRRRLVARFPGTAANCFDANASPIQRPGGSI
jgi:uncharacterized protein (TIGR02646 family)